MSQGGASRANSQRVACPHRAVFPFAVAVPRRPLAAGTSAGASAVGGEGLAITLAPLQSPTRTMTQCHRLRTETHPCRIEMEFDSSGRAMSVLAEVDVGLCRIGTVFVVHALAVEHQHTVGILFNRTRLPKV